MVTDWNKMFPNINEKYSDLLQSHSSLCGEILQMKADKEALIQQRDKAYSEKDAMLLQNEAMRKVLIEIHKYVGDGKGWDFDAALIDGMISDVLKPTDKPNDGYPMCSCGVVLPAPGIQCVKCGRVAIKRKGETFPLCADCGHDHRTEPGHYTTMNCNLKGCACTYFLEKRNDEQPPMEICGQKDPALRGGLSCVKGKGHQGNHEDCCRCWW